MIFFNIAMLLGLIGVSVPIIIHILNRRRATVVQWGAMQFLEASLASRNRRILIEEIILMIIRCLLVGALAFALARPFLKSRTLFAGGSDAQDIAIVIDGSMSMMRKAPEEKANPTDKDDSERKDNFHLAISEAHRIIDACRKADAVSVVLAGPTAQMVVPTPLSDRDDLHESLDDLSAPGGSMQVIESLHAATLALSSGTNPAKRIILITDGQRIGWDLSARKRWEFFAETADSLPTKPVVIVRTLPCPKEWRNVSISALSFSRKVVGTDRAVGITVTVTNTGQSAITPEAVELKIDGEVIERRAVGSIASGGSNSIVFEHRFEHPGPHEVSARVICDDDLLPDNAISRVVNVLKVLPVLVIEGKSSSSVSSILSGDAGFLRLALAPSINSSKPSGKAPSRKGKTTTGIEDKQVSIIKPTVVAAADVSTIKRFDKYAVVILVDVPYLPKAKAVQLMQFVKKGGGVLIALGDKARRDFYNGWKTSEGQSVLGCRCLDIRSDGEEREGKVRFAHVLVGSITNPGLTLLSDPSVSDLGSVAIKRHWRLALDQADKNVSVGATLDTGEPFLIQRRLSDGLVITLALPLNREFSDLPVHESYVPLVHELVYYLAGPGQQPMNLQPGEQFVFSVPDSVMSSAGKSARVAEVVDPRGQSRMMRFSKSGDEWQVRFSLTTQPGVYRLILPAALSSKLIKQGLIIDRVAREGIPFVVKSDPQESNFALLSRDDYRRANQFVPLRHADNLSQVIAAIRGGVPGSEIWRYVAIVILILLVGEILTTRAIAASRKMHLAESVAFGSKAVDFEEFGEPPVPTGKTVRPEEVSIR
ncbi:MAG: BatA domain-containing protein [Planctomycetes bacterium]|nr:BatA domain-containing protein [Planctomycetota bacterium]